jgi:hypothetical protein
MMKNTFTCLVLGLGFVLFNCDAFGQTVRAEDPVQVQFCDLLTNPQEGRLVRTTAIYRYGFEWSELYCPGCEGVVWLETSEHLKLNHSLKRKLKSNNVGRTVKVTVVGRMAAGGRYGHMGVYRSKFIVDRYERADVLLKESPVYSSLPESVKAKVKCSQ